MIACKLLVLDKNTWNQMQRNYYLIVWFGWLGFMAYKPLDVI